MDMALEVEAKFAVDDVDAIAVRLAEQGWPVSDPVTQDDQAYAPQTWNYGDPKLGVSFMRLRTVDGVHTMTVKRPDVNALSCVEHETTVDDRDEAHALLLTIGFRATVRIVKTRRTATWGETTVCLDEVEGLGGFLEVEQMFPDGADGAAVQERLAAFVQWLVPGARRTHETYDALVRAAQVQDVLAGSAI